MKTLERRLGLVIALFLPLGLACDMSGLPSIGDDQNDNGGSGNSGDNGNSGDSGDLGDSGDSGGSGGDDGTSRLTLRIVGPVGGDFARVYGVIDSGPLVHDDLLGRFPQSDFQLTLQSFSTDGIAEQTFAYPNGTEIALVAVEADGFLTASPPPDVIDSFPNQFVTWSGDVTGDAGDNPAALYFVLNGDRTITAEYKPMNAMYIEASGGGPHTSVSIDVDGTRYIIGDEAIAMSGVGASDNPIPHVLWGYYRDDAKVTLQVIDYVDSDVATCTGELDGPCFIFESWSGDCGGSGKTCVVEFFDEHRSTVHFTDING